MYCTSLMPDRPTCTLAYVFHYHNNRYVASEHAHMNACVYAHLPRICLPTCLRMHTHAYVHTSIHTHIHAYIHTYIHTCMHACMHTYMLVHTYIHTYIHACMHAYIHAGTYIHTYIHTYIRSHRHTYIPTQAYASARAYILLVVGSDMPLGLQTKKETSQSTNRHRHTPTLTCVHAYIQQPIHTRHAMQCNA